MSIYHGGSPQVRIWPVSRGITEKNFQEILKEKIPEVIPSAVKGTYSFNDWDLVTGSEGISNIQYDSSGLTFNSIYKSGGNSLFPNIAINTGDFNLTCDMKISFTSEWAGPYSILLQDGDSNQLLHYSFKDIGKEYIQGQLYSPTASRISQGPQIPIVGKTVNISLNFKGDSQGYCTMKSIFRLDSEEIIHNYNGSALRRVNLNRKFSKITVDSYAQGEYANVILKKIYMYGSGEGLPHTGIAK